jgi:hypothetical protein
VPFWSLGGSKIFETSYLAGAKIITGLDPGKNESIVPSM